MDILKKLREEFGITQSQAENTVRLLDEGNTVPFIARYRKEMTGSLDDQIIRQLSERLTALRNLEDRRTQVRTAIAEQGRLTDALAAKLGDNEFEEEILDIFKYIMKNSRRIQAKSLFDYNIFLIGFMGAGKSTVAGELKDKLEMDRVEMDQMIVENRGMSISEIFDEFGEAYFRNLESNTLIELQKRKQTIVSCGGGVVMREENSDHMKKNGRVVLLTAKPETIYERVKDSDERPILNGNMNVEYISGLMEKRKERYEAVADVTVATDGKNVTQICEEIIAKLIALDNEQGNKQA
jgi:shikimate kinase